MDRLSSFFDKLGPALASGIILAVLAGTATALVAWGSHSGVANTRFDELTSRVDALEERLEEFRKPGPRFTADDGARHERRLEKLEQQANECLYARAEVLTRLKNLEGQK